MVPRVHRARIRAGGFRPLHVAAGLKFASAASRPAVSAPAAAASFAAPKSDAACGPVLPCLAGTIHVLTDPGVREQVMRAFPCEVPMFVKLSLVFWIRAS